MHTIVEMGDLDDTQTLDCEWEAEEEHNNNNCPAPWARLEALERPFMDIDIYESDTVIGRAHTSGNKKVSKFHCRIHKDSSGQVSVSNLSKNGTHVNGSPLDIEQCSAVQHGDKINLGPLASGLPQYIFHVLDKSSQDERLERKRPNECLELDLQLENAKHLKLLKVRDDFKCCICLSIWHDVVSVAPCLHNFCNGCFSEWYKNKGMSRCNCPQCREPVVFVKRNPTLSNIIEDYLQEFPSLRRPSEEITHLDQKAIVRNNFVNVGGSDGQDVCTSDDDEDVEVVHCPQCRRPDAFAQAGDQFSCGPGTLHLTCTSCGGLMPERADVDVSQKCAGCSRALCGVYWRSQNISPPNAVLMNCTMTKMGEVTVVDVPRGAFQRNAYEQDVTKRYIQEERLQIQDVILEWLSKMDIGETDKPELPCSPQAPFAELYFCSGCADTTICHLLYKFRLSVPKSELPPDAAAREDCWYGRLCRTQVHKDSHARKFNHACEPGSRASRT